ncbi:aspartate aminotransferase family protein [Granulosicoccaceae sp. 1_MG-2023]|nr:aspartate aminotransferase family protein [Granulosicoccaceae sp. 1_MG-2023]
MMSALMHTYNRLALALSHGEGAWVYDLDGNRYLDALGGIAVCALGHAHPAVSRAICEQAGKLIHTSNIYRIPLQDQLGEALCSHARMDSAFICNSGAEANEAAIKLARLYGNKRGISNPAIVVMEGSFHGRTMATLSATGNRKIQAGFEPLVQGFIRAPYNNSAALQQIAENSRNVVAVLLEPVQGEGGIIVPDEGYLAAVREICDKNGWLMMVDEIQSGMGRTGQWFAWMHEDAHPDVLTSAKALGNGFPVGACLARGDAAEILSPGTHGSTFGGNPLACAAATTVIRTMDEDKLVARAGELGERILNRLRAELADLDGVADIRGRGLMIGVELEHDCAQLMQAGVDAGILLNVTAGKVIRLLPPYILSDEEADLLSEKVCALVTGFLKSVHSAA